MIEVATAPQTVAPPEQVREVSFDAEMERQIEVLLSRYPTRRAALIPLLWLCQERWGWISAGVMRAVADRLQLPPAFVEGVVTFYTMFQRKPPGRYLLQVCSTLSCQLCGAGELVEHLRRRLGVDFGGTTADGRFTLLDVQCLGACGEAPVIQVNNDYYTKLTVEQLDDLIDRLR